MSRAIRIIIFILGFTIVFSCKNVSKQGSTATAVSKNVPAKDTTISNIALVFVPKGAYKSGLYSTQDTINYDFFIGKYEITNYQFVTFLKTALAKGIVWADTNAFYCNYAGDDLVAPGIYRVKTYDNRIAYKNGHIIFDTIYGNHPATAVTWYGAMCFCTLYGFNMPSEREWEKAARGNNDYWFPWGNAIDSTYANYYFSNDPFETGTTPAGYYNGEKHDGFQTHNAVSAYGCYDMAGNAWEWTRDYWSHKVPYHTGKGGGYHYHTPAFLQVYYVSCYGPSTSPELDMNDIADGFRVIYSNP